MYIGCIKASMLSNKLVKLTSLGLPCYHVLITQTMSRVVKIAVMR